MSTTKQLRDAAFANRKRIAAAVAGLASIFTMGAVADVARGETTPTAASTVAMTMNRSERADLAFRLSRPAPAAKELRHDYRVQENFYYCGPAATRIALSARGFLPTQDLLAGRLGTTENGTNSILDITRVLNQYGTKPLYTSHTIPGGVATADQAERLRHHVVQAITTGYPVAANIAGTASDVDGVAHSFPGGHYLAVVGYRDNGRQVKIADSAFVDGYGSYWMSHTDLANWMATRGYSA